MSGIRFGGDYNPEQWPREVWDEDVALMRRAGVTTATVGVFSWGWLEPEEGRYEFGWLDEVIELLHAGGIRVLLATATASPPAWLARDHPDSLPVTAEGVRLGFGSRQQYSPSSAAYRTAALRLVERLAERYGAHPALEAWHIGNEYACHVPESHDPESARAFRTWLAERYGSIERLNEAWGTAFWSQRYASFDEVSTPALAPTSLNPTQLLDFRRFSSDALLGLLVAERQVLRRLSPGVPVTTNFMGFFPRADYWRWAREVDFVSDDSYPDPADPEAHVLLAASRDLMRSLGAGRPWLLMEQATSAVNWRERNAIKPAGVNRVQSLQALARGADGILYFQWRQSRAGAEKFHSGMVPHAGADSRVFREVQALGEELAGLGGIAGTATEPARVAIVFDWDSWGTFDQEALPARVDYLGTVLDWYRPMLERGVPVDFVAADGELEGYRLVIAPSLVTATDAALERLDAFARAGGTLLVGFQSGVLDENLHVRLGGYLGPLRQTLGLRIEEFAPVAAAPGGRPASVTVEGRIAGTGAGAERSDGLEWQDVIRLEGAEAVARFADGDAVGHPALTRHRRGDGEGWYLGTRPSRELAARLVERLLGDADLAGLFDAPVEGVEAVRRGGRLFLLNHTTAAATVSVRGESITVPGRDAVIR
ncbi:MAG: beta-galactosidase [Microbacteriaceae bacterium]